MKSMTHKMNMTDGMPAMMRGKRLVYIGIGLAAAMILWFLFRPELLFINKTVNESLPGTPSTMGGSMGGSMMNSRPLANGTFHSVAHETKGMATIHQIADGKRVLRLTGFETSNGPHVHVFMVAAMDAADSDTVKNAGYVDLGSMKGNIGDQNYDVPADLDLNKYQAVTIWCNRFGVNFGTASLAMAGMDNGPMQLSSGMFHSVAHDTKGTATVYRTGENKRVLRLTGFETSNGPDVRLYLVAAADAMDSDAVKNAGFVELGKLKGNIGDQNYDIPAEVDLGKYQAVTVWCARFGVNFGTAPLKNMEAQ